MSYRKLSGVVDFDGMGIGKVSRWGWIESMVPIKSNKYIAIVCEFI